MQNRNSPLEVKPFIFKGSLTPSNLPRKVSSSNLHMNSYDIKVNSNTIADFKEKDDPKKKPKSTKKSLESHFKSDYNPKHKLIDKKLNKSNHNDRNNRNFVNSNPKPMERKIVTSMSSRFQKNDRKNVYSDNLNSLLSIPYLGNPNNNLIHNSRKDLINLGLYSNMNNNVFNNQGMYVALPFLMENRGESAFSRNLLVDPLKNEWYMKEIIFSEKLGINSLLFFHLRVSIFFVFVIFCFFLNFFV